MTNGLSLFEKTGTQMCDEKLLLRFLRSTVVLIAALASPIAQAQESFLPPRTPGDGPITTVDQTDIQQATHNQPMLATAFSGNRSTSKLRRKILLQRYRNCTTKLKLNLPTDE